MKAIVYHEYGSPDVLRLKEVDTPVPNDNEVLVRVHAASINSWDWDMVRGKPYIIRMWGLFKPKCKIPGADIAGRVEAVGESVTKFQPGDAVFGDLCNSGWGGYAEYVCVEENSLALKSSEMSFEEAAAYPQAGVMALQGIRDKGKIKPGHQVLINGAGGGVGTFAVQLAKYYGAEVTAVDSSDKLELAASIGADHTIDYKKEDFVQNGRKYDLILDPVANRSIYEYKQSLTSTGKFVMVGGTGKSIIQSMVLGPLLSESNGKKLGILAHEPNKDLNFLTDLFEKDVVKPVIDKVFPLNKIQEAFRYYASGNHIGKVVISV